MWQSQDSTPGSLAAEPVLFPAELLPVLFSCLMEHKDLRKLGLESSSSRIPSKFSLQTPKSLEIEVLNSYFHLKYID